MPWLEVVELGGEHRNPSSGGRGLTTRLSYHTCISPTALVIWSVYLVTRKSLPSSFSDEIGTLRSISLPKGHRPSFLNEWFDLAFQKALFWACRRRRSLSLGAVCLHMGMWGAVEACGFSPDCCLPRGLLGLHGNPLWA